MVEVCFSHINVYWKGVPLNGFLVVNFILQPGWRFPHGAFGLRGLTKGREDWMNDDSGTGRMEHGGQPGLVAGNRDYPYEVMYILRIPHCSTVITSRRDEEVLRLEAREKTMQRCDNQPELPVTWPVLFS